MLRTEDFSEFFTEVYGFAPFPWQRLLLQRIAEQGRWPETLDLPTGSGKTAAIDVAVFHLALEADRGHERQAPVRIAFVVDRRLVVDDAHERARELTRALRDPPGAITSKVAERLKLLAGDGPPLIARRLRGGVPREDDWARTPAQPTVLCSTVDQVGSRLLFRGYGVSDSMKPVHAGLIGADCLILLDEAHLAEPFRQTLDWTQQYRGSDWRECAYTSPSGVALLTATPNTAEKSPFGLDQDPSAKDSEHPILRRRLEATKPARLLAHSNQEDREQRFVGEVCQALASKAQAVGIVVNRVARARSVFEKLRKQLDSDSVELILLIGPARPAQRDQVAERLAPIRTGASRKLDKPLVLVATQCIEAGVDIDLDALFTEAAPLDCLRQRFGRLNRDGRGVVPRAAIIAIKEEVGARSSDPVYGEAIRESWKVLEANATQGEKREKFIDFGIQQFSVPQFESALSPKPDAPVLMPAHLDLLSQTAPIPAADPEVALYLHGPSLQPDTITVIWRGDVDPAQDAARMLTLVPPRSGEAIELPLWAVRHWLSHSAKSFDDLADVATAAPDTFEPSNRNLLAYRWKGPDERSRWIRASEIRAGDTVVVPTRYGGIDVFGWHPSSKEAADDLADLAAEPYRGRRFVLRIAPGLIGDLAPEALSDVLAGVRQESWETVRDAISKLAIPAPIKEGLAALNHARGQRGRPRIETHFDVYCDNEDGQPLGIVFVAPRGLVGGSRDEEGRPNSTEDDASGSLYGFAQTLSKHSAQVEGSAESFAQAAGLPEARVADLKLAGFLHDEGKRDTRFQRWLHHGDPLGADPDDETTVLAKSGRALPPNAREKAGLPPHWRHEALSVRLARAHRRFKEANDADLVLWLVGTHHGYGRPLFPYADPAESVPDVGPQSLAFDWNGMDWATLFQTLKDRYGVWELARMEAILRLADHRASEEAAESEGAL